jgi:hypothetical protein
MHECQTSRSRSRPLILRNDHEPAYPSIMMAASVADFAAAMSTVLDSVETEPVFTDMKIFGRATSVDQKGKLPMTAMDSGQFISIRRMRSA